MKLTMALAAAIRKRDLTQTEAAERVGVTKQAMSLWLCGKRTPRRRFWKALRRELGVECRNGGRKAR